ncbi:MAG: carboxypeptidase regulatory-like domain-containing protein [Candidatus Edwardsbacteria bacterium]|nr:carboxypeptidase regulatory-like domain-containing protein [Candidatus Edwardsbacteria bacterium]
MSGIVRDENAGGAPLAGAQVSASSPGGNFADTTDPAGGYSFPALPIGTYTIRAAAPGYVDSSLHGIAVAPGAYLAFDFSLGYPALALTPSDSISVLLPPASCDSTRWLVVRNDGTREASCQISWPEGAAKAAGDSVWGIDLEGPTADNLCLGVEHAGNGLWVSGAAGSPSADPNWLYRFGRDGVLSRTLPQPGGGGWGWRDLCWDGQFLYGASAGDIMQIDTADGDTTGVRIASPCAVARGLAYDGSADRFFVTDFGDSIYQLDRAGTVLHAWANPRNTFGLAWDAAADGPWLWCLNDSLAGGPLLSADQFDPRAGAYTGLRFACNTVDPANAAAGGLAFSTALVPGRGTLIALLQDWHDRLVAYDVRPDNARWLALSRASLTLPPAGTDSVRLTFDNAGLDSSLAHRAWIRIATGIAGRTDSVLAVLRSPYGVGGGAPAPAAAFALLPCRPNPLRTRTAITFSLPRGQDAELAVYNIAGQRVRTLLAGGAAAGWRTVEWNGTDDRGRRVGSGVYLCRLRAGAGQRTIRMALVR